MKLVADIKGNLNESMVYKKALSSLEKYPLPILTGDQSVQIEGFGQKLSTVIDRLCRSSYKRYESLDKDYKKVLIDETSHEDANKVEIDEIQEEEYDTCNYEDIKNVKANKIDIEISSVCINEQPTPFSDITTPTPTDIEKQKAATKVKSSNIKPKQANRPRRSKSLDFNNTTNKKSKSPIKNSFISLCNNISINKPFAPSIPDLPQQTNQAIKVLRNSMKNIKTHLYIDNREKKRGANDNKYFLNKLSSLGISCHTANLSLGDFMWILSYEDEAGVSQNMVYNYIIERKILSDMFSSIQDGRYNQQKYRLKNTGIDNIIYLIEGREEAVAFQQGCHSSIRTVIDDIRVYNKYMVYRSKDVNDTIRYINMMNNKIMSDVQKNIIDSPADSVHVFVCNYQMFNDLYKKEQTDNIMYSALKSLNGCGNKCVQSLMNRFGCLKEIYQWVNSKDRRDEDVRAFLNGFNEKQKKSIVGMFVHYKASDVV